MRTESSTVVREALASVTAVPRKATVMDAVTSVEANDPLYRRTFVGRENEVKQLTLDCLSQCKGPVRSDEWSLGCGLKPSTRDP
jgi:hypothetical protein